VKKILFALLCVFCVQSSAAGPSNEQSQWDLGLRTGLVVGTVTQTDVDSGTDRRFKYGGIPLAFVFSNNLSTKLTFHLEPNIVADISNKQITRKGIDIGFSYHLNGGSRRVVTDLGHAHIVSAEDNDLSIITRIGFHGYSATAETTVDSIEGSLLQLALGLQYRFEVSDNSSLTTEVGYSVFGLPSGPERLATALLDIGLTWRFFI
jgi:hypothetical protein